MARQSADIELLFGVKGGGTLKEGSSGALIRDQLNGIVGQINRTPLEIKFKADEAALRNLRDQIKKIMGTINVPVGATGGSTGSSGGSKSSGKSSGSTGALKDKALDSALEKIEKLQHKLNTTQIKLDSIIDVDGADAISKKITDISANIERFKKTTENGMGKVKFDNELAKYTREVTGAKNEVDEFSMKTKEAAKAQKQLDSELKKAGESLEKVELEFKQSTDSSHGMTTQFSRLSKELLGFYSIHTVVMKAASAIKDMVNNAIELETAFSDTRIVTHATEREMQQLGVTITAVANDTAASIESLVSATTAYARLGYSLEESTILAKYTGMLEKVGNVDTQRAEDAITSIVKAFPKDVDVRNIEQTMDKLVKTGNNFPISVAQIATGMTNASSALASAGNSFEQSVALLTAANTTVQNAEKASTALRTMAARIRKTDADIGEDGEAITEAKHEELIRALSKHKVELTNLNNEYRSTYDIMKDIATHWHEMTSMEQSAIAELVAGTRQQVVFYSIIENFREASNAMDAMADSAGTLQESYNVYLDTAAAHVEQFNIAWKTFSMDFVNNNAIKRIVDVGTAILNVADSLQRVHLLLPTIIASVTAFRGMKLALDLQKQRSAVEALVNVMLSQTDVQNNINGLTKETASIFNSMSFAQQALVVKTLENVDATRQQQAQAVLAAMAEQGLADSEIAAAEATDALNFSMKGMMASNPVGWIALAVSLIGTIGSVIYDWTQKNKEATESLDDIKERLTGLSDQAKETITSFRQLNEQSSDIIPKFVELAKGVDQYGQKTEKLTDDEYKEFVRLNNQLADLFPQISYGMDESGNAMLDLNYKSADLADTLWRIVDAQREMTRLDIANQMEDAVGEAVKADKLYKSQESDIKDAISALGELRTAFSGADVVSEYSVLGNFDMTSAIEAIRKVSPEIDDIIAKLGKSTDLAGAITYSLFGNGGQYLVADAFIDDIDRVLDHTEARLAESQRKAGSAVAWNLVKQTAVAWAQGQQDYIEASDTVQNVIDKMIGDIDMTKVNVQSGHGLQTYLYDNVIEPLSKLDIVGQDAMSSFEMSMSMFDSGKIGVSGMSDEVDSLSAALSNSIPNATTVAAILNAIGATELKERIDFVRASIRGEAEELDAFFGKLSSGDLNIAYSIVSQEGSLTLDELRQKLIEAKEAAEETKAELSETVELGEFLDSLSGFASKIDSITSSMQKLAKGTSLTTKELISLASEYPQLLKQSNLFTDGSITGQKKLLETVLKCNEEQYKSTIQLKLNELKVTIDAIKKQQEVEKEKQKYLLQIYAMTLSGNIENNKQFNIAVGKLNELEAKKYAEIKSGEVKVAAASYKKIDDAAVDTTNHIIDNAYVPGGRALTETYAEAAQTTVGIVYDMHEWIRQIMTSGEEGSAADAVAIARGIADQNTMAYWYQRFNQNAVQSRASYSVTSPDDYRRGIWEEMQQSIQDSVVYDNAIRELEATYDNLSGLLDVKFDELISSVDSSSDNSSGSGSNSSSSSGSDDVSRRIRDILNQLLRDLRAFYDAQKKMLKDEIEEEKYLREQAEKRKTINDIENLIAQLGADESAWAQKRRIALEEELKDAKEELAAFEQEKAVSQAEDMYDREYEKQAAIINELINDTNVTVEEINGKLGEIYKLLDSSAHSVGLPYASGTSNATSGLHMIDEHGSETIFQSANGNRYRMFSGGEKVLNAGASEFLYKFASSYGKNLTHGVSGIPSGISRNDSPSISMGDIIISGNADDRTISEIRRAQRDQVRDLLTMFGRMK